MQRRTPPRHAASARPAPPPAQLLAAAIKRHRRGRLDEAATLYRRILAVQPAHPDALHLLGLVAHARGDHAGALALIDRAIAASRRTAAFHVARGGVLLALAQPQQAAESLRRAIALDPARADAHNTLGNVELTLGNPAAAVACYRRALALHSDYPEALNNLGSALRAAGRLGEAAAALREAIRLRPQYPAALANLGLVLQEQGHYAAALDAYDRAIAADPALPAARGNRALLLLLLGRLEEGFAEYEWRWRMPGFATPRRAFAQPAWDGAALAGRTLLVHAEQGLGSAIQFVRYLRVAAARGGSIVLECPRPLERLFRRSLAGGGGPLSGVVVKGDALPPFDWQAPLMSLPHLLATTLATIPADVPYLFADDADSAMWRARLAAAPPPRVGLVWAGNPRHENDANRSMPAAALAPVLGVPGASFFSLQVPATADDLAALPSGRVTDLAPLLADFAATAAVVANLDLVISVDTAVAHLAGALARPVWLLLPYVPEWRWLLDRDDSPWYPTMRLFRQRAPGDWPELTGRVAQALAGWAPEGEGAR